MKKIRISSYCIILCVICQVFTCYPTFAITEAQNDAISDGCTSIHNTLKTIQSQDSRTRVYLGGYYEKFLSKFITPLNLRLVKNNLPSAELTANQTSFATARADFVDDFIDYQKSLEDLLAINCKTEPAAFYDKLKIVREKRETMAKDVTRLKGLISSHIKTVEKMKEEL